MTENEGRADKNDSANAAGAGGGAAAGRWHSAGCMCRSHAARRSHSATAVRAVFGRRAAFAFWCHNGLDYESRCDMACCKSGRRSKRRCRNNPMLQRAEWGLRNGRHSRARYANPTIARNWPIVYTRCRYSSRRTFTKPTTRYRLPFAVQFINCRRTVYCTVVV